MSGLYVVRSEHVPVEQIKPGDTLILPNGRQVEVERVDEYDGAYVVRWHRPAERGEPGYPRPGETSDAYDGRYLGSTVPVPAGHRWTVAR